MILRNCPWCDTNKSQLLFHYDYDFIMKMYNNDKTFLDMIGIEKDGKTSLVKCDECNFIFQKEDWEIDKHLINYYETTSYADAETSLDFEWKAVKYSRKFQKIVKIISELLGIIKISINGKESLKKIKILDFGCGWGTWLNIANCFTFVKVYGFDTNKYKLDYIQRNNNKIFVTNKINELNKIDGGFDIIICNDVLEHVNNPRQLLNTIHDLLAPKGLIYLSLPVLTPRKIMGSIEKMKLNINLKLFHIGHINFFSPKHFNNLMESLGFKPVRTGSDILFYDYSSIIKTLIKPFYRYLISIFGIKDTNMPVYRVWIKG